jgi:7,8-dihydro-6-hydroxymethylpterin dimethyltransferase
MPAKPYKAKTKSLCPQCLKTIEADIVEEKGKILIKKHCAEHGDFQDTYWSDADLYHKFAACADDGTGIENPQTKKEKGCPGDCGLCTEHKTNTLLANLDVTNRCNQTCPICFANSAVCGYLYEPAFDEIVKMMKTLRKQKPVPAPAIQFSGGEPTLRADLPEIIRTAKKLGFIQIQIASNGVKLARSAEYAKKLKGAGLQTIYLQFDGLKEETYKKIRGYNALPNKLKALENCRGAGLRSIVLVPTIARGVNEEEIGDIIDFAVKNCDVVKSINFQPVSFSGRIEQKELEKMRITIPDVLKKIEAKTKGEISANDFTAIPFINAVSRFISAWQGKPASLFTIHPHCGAATYVFVENGKITPITRFINADRFRKLIQKEFFRLKNNSSSSAMAKVRVLGEVIKELPSLIDKKLAPKNIKIVDLIIGILKNDSREAIRAFHNNVLFIGIMHFMDPYNFDAERVSRCGIHYVTPDQKLIPFCSYNALYREATEKKFSKPLPKK